MARQKAICSCFFLLLSILHVLSIFAQETDFLKATDPTPLTTFDTDDEFQNSSFSIIDVTVIDEKSTLNETMWNSTTMVSIPYEEIIGNSTSNTTTDMEDTTTIGTPPPCKRSYCKNHGECVSSFRNNGEIRFECICDNGYIGRNCQIRDLCLTAKNSQGEVCSGGACVYNEDMTMRYCNCFYGEFWNEQEMQCKRSEPPCFPNPCAHNGVCRLSNHEKSIKQDPSIMSSSNYDFNCTCVGNYTGPTCEIINNCAKDENGTICGEGICRLDSRENEYHCDCFDGYFLDYKSHLCKPITTPCELDPCSGNGVCSMFSDGLFNCSCDHNYTGERCQITDRCTVDEDGNRCTNGACEIIDSERVQLCTCNEGFFLDEDSGTCMENQPPCLPNPCANGGICNAYSEEEFNCTCAKGFSGEQCSFRDRCILDGGKAFCGSSATCLMDYQSDTFYCACPKRKYFDYRERECTVIDYCPLMSCADNQVCKDSKCECSEGYAKDSSGECKADFCSQYGCPSEEMLCTESTSEDPNDYKCTCKPTYAFNGIDCVPAVCAIPSLNNCSQICTETIDGFQCACEDGFLLSNDSSSCVHDGVVECENFTCSPGRCIVGEEGMTCLCPPGYLHQGGHCIDLCMARKLPTGICPEDKCQPIEDKGFRCECEGKYEMSEDGITCKVRKMCVLGQEGWEKCTAKGAECIEDWTSIKGYRCQCPFGYEETMTYGTCERVCENPAHQKTCSKLGAVCGIDENYEFKCRCPPAFKQNVNGGFCTKLADVSYFTEIPVSAQKYSRSQKTRRLLQEEDVDFHLLEMDIFNAMRTLFEGFTSANVLKCKFTSDDTILCKVELQFEKVVDDKVFSRIQSPSSTICNETISEDYVLLPPSLVLVRGDALSEMNFQKLSLCDEDIKAQMCGSETSCTEFPGTRGFTCTCLSGFRQRERIYPTDGYETFIETCKDINECTESNKCPSNSECINTIGNYKCSCLPGFRYVNDSGESQDISCIELCNPNPCIHGECIQSGEHMFECKCKPGYGGKTCDFEDRNYKAANVRTIMVGSVLGGILLVAVILFSSTISRLRKKKRLEDHNQILYSTEMVERRHIGMTATNAGFEKD